MAEKSPPNFTEAMLHAYDADHSFGIPSASGMQVVDGTCILFEVIDELPEELMTLSDGRILIDGQRFTRNAKMDLDTLSQSERIKHHVRSNSTHQKEGITANNNQETVRYGS